MEQFMQWLARHDITVDAVVPYDFEDTGRGMKATRDIAPGELLLKIPEYLILSAKTALDSEIGPFFREANIRNGVDLICIYLLFEKNKTSSAWREYIDILPKTFSDLFHFSDDELQELQCTVKIERIKAKKRSLQEKYNMLKTSIEKAMKKSLNWLTFGEYLWSWSCVMSRSFYIPGRKRLNIEKDEYNVIPFADMFNHSSKVESRGAFGPNSGAYKLFTDTPYKEGDQVFLCYGQHSNEVLLKYYGFVIEDNKHNSVRFYIDWNDFPASDLPAKLNLIRDYHVSEGKYVGLEGEFSWNMMTCLRIMLSENCTHEDWARAILTDSYEHCPFRNGLLLFGTLKPDRYTSGIIKSTHKFEMQNSDLLPRLEDAISRENEMAVWEYLKTLVQRRTKEKITTVEADVLLLEREKNFNKRNAITLRIGEKNIFKSLINLIEERLR